MGNNTEPTGGHGKKPNQKLKPYIVLQYLLKNTDEDHVATASDIILYLNNCGIYAERRSIYRDIKDINKVAYLLEYDDECEDIFEAEEAVENDSEKLVIYDKSKKGFYVRQRHFELSDIRILASCVYSAKFIPESQVNDLINVICEFVSKPQAKKIKQDVFLTDRIATNNKQTILNIEKIQQAMSKTLDGEKHNPEKISFKYLKYAIRGNVHQQTDRRNGERYIVSPYHLLINDGNYYLLAFDERYKEMRTYRVDRMKGIERLNEPREGKAIFEKIDIKTYAQRTFSMYGGETQRITIQFAAPLLDTVVDRFGAKNVIYGKVDKDYFTINAPIAVSEQFFSWLCGFGKRAKILEPAPVVENFKEFLGKISSLYE